MKVFGLTGGIASGKSLAAKYFAEAGLPVIDADLIAKTLSQKDGAAHAAIVKRFGSADRATLREIIFADAGAKKDLEEILHPLIQAESQRQILAHGSRSPVVIYEAALLIETGRYREFNGLIVVAAPHEVRRQRLIDRDRILAPLAERMIAAQASDEDRRALATHVIDNSGTVEELRAQVQKLSAKLLTLP